MSQPTLDQLKLKAQQLDIITDRVQGLDMQVIGQSSVSVPHGQCSYDNAFSYLAGNVHVQGMKVTSGVGGLLTIEVANIGLNKEITVDGKEIPCFVDSIPEMFTSYIVAQLLRIAEAIDKNLNVEDTVGAVRANLRSKVVVLHQMNEYYSKLHS